MKAKDIKKGDVIEDKQVVAVPTRVAEVDHLKGGIVMVRFACRKTWHAYDGERELECGEDNRPSGL